MLLNHGFHSYGIRLFPDNSSGLTVTIPSVEMLTLNICYVMCSVLVACCIKKIQLPREKNTLEKHKKSDFLGS